MKGGALALLFGKPKGKADKEEKYESEEEGDEVDEGLAASARDILDAVKADDEKAYAEALKSFLEQC